MIHILFDMSASGSLKWVFRELGIDRKEKVIDFCDTFSIGPIYQLEKEEGRKLRFEWMKKWLNNENDELSELEQRFEKTISQIISIPDGSHITLWTSENAHEQTGLRFVVNFLKGKSVDITMINTRREYKKPFPVKKEKYAPLSTGEILLEKLQLVYEQGSGIFFTDHDRENLEKEWQSLTDNQETLRIWRNGRIHSVPDDYYDEFIIKKAKKLHCKQKTKDFMQSARLIGEVLGYLDQYVGDGFLEYRLRKLIERGVFVKEGSTAAMRYYSVKLE
ncbi:DUF1835 domain-containing protein [Robertmurraya kyonggiensis]|uniref:DUF1835 domain-containing protein n=1 Tax=Robertmurraya kyonggiensis TaxID=1037680 RepID=A0A4U1D1H6_9BACI|nr:DUF1835 domain-containing protein [Robertmurraya kyonggiensis]TKC16165.1 DUF1835 domain-containing protein [Robertmurraya kyonggiensis]